MENIAGGGTVLDDARERTASAAGGREPSVRSYQIYLAPAGDSPLRGPLGWLARRYGLDVYGGSLLSRRAAIEMGFAALMLTVIVSFDLGAWTLLFNAIFHSTGDILDVTWVSLLAFAAGLLLAFAVFIYERQFVSADTSGNRVGLVGAFLVRVTIVVIAAAITAQPVELLIFRGPIVRRIHEEGMAAELVARRNEIQKKSQKVDTIAKATLNPEQFVTEETRTVGAAQTAASGAESDLDRVRSRLSAARTSLVNATGEVKKQSDRFATAQRMRREAEAARGGLGDPAADARYNQAVTEENEAATALRNARVRQSRAETSIGNLESEFAEAEGQVTRTKEDLRQAKEAKDERLKKVEESLDVGMQKAEKEVQELIDYIDLVRKEGSKRKITWRSRDGHLRFAYQVPSYDFFEQLRVLQDLREARWAKWPVEEAMQKHLAKDYGLEWHAANDKRLIADAEFYNRSYWVTFGIAFVIPMLMLAVKLLMTRELSAYFSSEYQARNGNPDALLLNRTRDELRERSWWWGLWRRITRRRSVPTAAVLPSASEAV